MVFGQSAYTDSLPPSLVLLLHWWLDYETLSRSTASSTAIFLTSHTDASKECGGAHLEPLSLIMYGMWSPQEYHLHINNLELRAVLSRLHTPTPCVCKPWTYSFFERASTSLSRPNIPGRLNALADGLSRNTSSFLLIVHLIRKWPTRFFSRSVIQWSTCLRPETTTDFLCTWVHLMFQQRGL